MAYCLQCRCDHSEDTQCSGKLTTSRNRTTGVSSHHMIDKSSQQQMKVSDPYTDYRLQITKCKKIHTTEVENLMVYVQPQISVKHPCVCFPAKDLRCIRHIVWCHSTRPATWVNPQIDLPSICHQHVRLVSRPYNCLHIHNKLTQP
jgi:hypothetical protein